MSLSTSASSRRRNLSSKAWIRKRLVSTPRSAVINNSSRSSRSSASTTLRPLKSRSIPPLRASRVRPNRSRRRRNIPPPLCVFGNLPGLLQVLSRQDFESCLRLRGLPEGRRSRLGFEDGGDGRRRFRLRGWRGFRRRRRGRFDGKQPRTRPRPPLTPVGRRPPAAIPGASGAENRGARGRSRSLFGPAPLPEPPARTRPTLLPPDFGARGGLGARFSLLHQGELSRFPVPVGILALAAKPAAHRYDVVILEKSAMRKKSG